MKNYYNLNIEFSFLELFVMFFFLQADRNFFVGIIIIFPGGIVFVQKICNFVDQAEDYF